MQALAAQVKSLEDAFLRLQETKGNENFRIIIRTGDGKPDLEFKPVTDGSEPAYNSCLCKQIDELSQFVKSKKDDANRKIRQLIES